MASTDLPWMVLGRKVKPYALAVSMSTAVVAHAMLIERDDVGASFDAYSAPGVIVGVCALLAVLSLWAGWWLRLLGLLEVGLLLSVGVWMSRGSLVWIDEGPTANTVWFSFAWVVASGGAYLLERFTGGRP